MVPEGNEWVYLVSARFYVDSLGLGIKDPADLFKLFTVDLHHYFYVTNEKHCSFFSVFSAGINNC